MLKIKQIQTISKIDIRLNYWARVMLYPLASFKLTENNLLLHLLVTETDRYSLIYIEPNPRDQYDTLKEFPSIPVAVLRVLKDMPLDPTTAEPVTFINKMSDLDE